MDFPYKHVHEVWVGNSSADPFDTILGRPWKWSQPVKKLVYNLLKGRLQPTYTCVPLLSLAVARLLSTPGQLTLPIASPYTNLQSPTFVSAIGAPSNPRSASTGKGKGESGAVMGFNRVGWHVGCGTCIGVRVGVNPHETWSDWEPLHRPLGHLAAADPQQWEESGMKQAILRRPCGDSRSVWNLNGDCLDVTYGCSSRSDACIVSILQEEVSLRKVMSIY